MTDKTDTQDKKPLSMARPGRLELKKTVETGQIRQSFSHGRSKAVTVEVRKKRTFAPGASGQMTEMKKGPEIAPAPQPTAPAPAPEEPRAPQPAARTLTEGEKAARARALQGTMRAEEIARREYEEEQRRKAEEEANRPPSPVVEEPASAPESAPVEAAAAAAPAGAPAQQREAPRPAAGAKPAAAPRAPETEEEEPRGPVRKPGVPPKRPGLTVRKEDDRRRGKLTITKALDTEGSERVRSLAAFRRQKERERRLAHGDGKGEQIKVVREVVIPETITVQELANRMAERAGEVIKTLMKMGVMATINQSIDADTAELVVAEFHHHSKRVAESDVEIGLSGDVDSPETLQPRPPVVTVMGHVDHGKTSLLDALRSTDVAAREAGGITQHIGAYQVTLESGQRVTFLDTPGHEAFTAMRARGAKLTDIVVLVVAADDGVMPQTIEAIHHAKAANVPIIVAINKIDKPDAKPERVKNELLQHGIVLESMGGEVLSVEVSAKQGTNLDKLLEAILLQSEVLELKANPDRMAQGVVVEAKMERGKGTVATVLVQRGTLDVGDIIVAGGEWGRVRALHDDHGRKVKAADPGMPVEVLGLQGTPSAGDDFIEVENEARAREITEFRQRKTREARVSAGARGTVEQMLSAIAAGVAKDLPLVIKADVQGSVEAIIGALEKMSTSEVAVRILHSAVGGINESDVTLARASNALVLGFNVRANPQARDLARRDGIEIRYYSIIYDLTNDVKAALSGMLTPGTKENFL
ncbi:MAG TPA: translation initiation factor IF-2, partial [Alphaproteobacteria bacterium]|nr:translation initiation factor IF-2 [Alphaproteobacteria bacterium]